MYVRRACASTLPLKVAFVALSLLGSIQSASAMTLSGTLYSDEGVTTITSGKTIAIAVGTTTTSLHTTTSDGAGAWTFNLGAAVNIGTSTSILIWVDGDATTRASLFTKASSSVNNIAGLDLYQNRVIVSHEGTSGTSTTISNMSFYDYDNDNDIQYSAATTTNTITVFSNQELHVKTGKTFAPGGNVTINANASTTSQTDGNFHIANSATYTAGGATMLGGNFMASSSATFTPGSYGVVMNATTTGKIVYSLTTSMGNMLFTSATSSSTYSFAGSATTTNFYIGTTATVTAPTLLTVEGDYVNAGGFIHNSGTVRMASTSAHTIAGITATSSAFSSLTIDGTGIVDARIPSQTANDTSETTIQSLTIDQTNGVLYGGSASGGIIYRCVLSTGCNDAGDFTVATDTPGISTIQSLTIDQTNGVLYAGSSVSGGLIYRCVLSTGCDGTGDFILATSTSVFGVYSLAIDQVNGTLYAGSGSTGFVFRCTLSTGCDSSTDFTVATDTAAGNIYSLDIDQTNRVLYAGTNGGGFIVRCALSTGCDGVGDFTIVSSSTFSLIIDQTNGVLYGGSASGGLISRCVLSTGCDNDIDFTIATDTVETTIYAFAIDQTNGVLYGGSASGGIIYRCVLSTGCNDAGDFTVATDTPESLIGAFAIDQTNGVVYGGASSGIIFRCPFCGMTRSSVTAVSNLTIQTGASLLNNEEMRISGNYSNNGTSSPYTSTSTATYVFTGSSAQTISGTLTGSSSLPNATFIGSGTKTISSNASTTGNVVIGSGSTVSIPNSLSLGRNLESNGTINNSGTMYFTTLGTNATGTLTGAGALGDVYLTSTQDLFTVATDTGEAFIQGLALDRTNQVLYAGTSANGLILRCPLTTNCDGATDFAVATDTGTGLIHGMIVDPVNQVLYAGSGSAGWIFRCALSTGCDSVSDFTLPFATTSASIATVRAFAIDSTNQVLYVGTGSGGIILRCILSTGCDTESEFTIAADTTTTIVYNLDFDAVNGVLYLGTGGLGIVLRCVVSSGCDALTEFTTTQLDTAETTMYSVAIDRVNDVLYVGSGNNGRLFRCPLSTGCDVLGDLTQVLDSPSQIIRSLTIDTTNNILYVGSQAQGAYIYRCILSTGCDTDSDFTTYTDTQQASVYNMVFNPVDHTVYAATGDTNGYIYRRASGFTFGANASTTDLTIGTSSTLVAPPQLTVGGDYTNSGTFMNNGGTLDVQAYIKNYIAGVDSNASPTTTGALQVNTIKISGNYAYVGKDGNGTACSQVAGSAIGCELMVFDISDTTNPRYVAGRDGFGSATSTGSYDILDLEISGNYLYVSRQSVSASNCTQVAGTAQSCELQVYDISSSTNPIYVAGRDADGSSTGVGTIVNFYDILVSDGYLYGVKSTNATACSQSAGSAIGCELMVFDVSDPTNPTYVAGRDNNGTATGTSNVYQGYTVAKSGNTLYTGWYRDTATACQQTLPATGCEIKIFDVSDPTNPIYVAGRDSTASSGGSGGQLIADLTVVGNYLYAGKEAGAGTCSQSAGSASACEILVFDISSTTNPVYVAGRDADGASAGTASLGVNNIEAANGFVYVGKAGSATACSQTAGSAVGCEYMVFDISSSTNPTYVAGLDMGGSADGTETLANGALAISGSEVYVGKAGSATACSQTAGSAVGCELMILRSSLLSGSMTGSSTLNDLQVTKGVAEFGSVASTTDITLASSSVLVAPTQLTLSGNYSSKGIFVHNGGTTTFSSTTAQTITNTMADTLSFGTVVLSGTSTKTFTGNASTTNFTIQNGATAVLPTLFAMAGNYVNNGTTTAGTGTTTLNGTTTQSLSGTMTGTSAFNNLQITNTSGAGSSTQSILFLASASTTDTFSMTASTSAQFLAGATSTFQNIKLSGASGQKVWLRSSTPGTQYGFYVPGTQRDVSYVDAQDNSACPTIILATNGTNVNSGNNTCWTFASAYATVASNADQIFAYLQATTTINPITITEDASSASITATNDIRLIIATSTTNMRWDTTDTTATITGTASGKVSGTVSYAGDGAILVIDVTSDFSPSDTLTISDLSYARFGSTSPATVALGVRTSGTGTSTDNSDSKTVTITGTIAIGSHTSGQIDNILTSRTVDNGELLAFKLTPAGESFNITGLAFPLKGINGIATGELTDAYLYRDMNGDQAYDAGDVAVGGSGSVSISGQTGTITFSETFDATTTQDYLLIGDVTEAMPTDALVLALSSANLTSTGATSLVEITESGGIDDYQHIRGGAGAGGGGGAIGGAPPAGDGIRTGGEEGGGGDIDSNSGDTIGHEVGFNGPTSNTGSWTTGGSGYTSDGSYATANSSVSHVYGSFGFSVPSNNQITGIVVKLEASGSTAAGTISVRLSWDGGSSVTSLATTDTLTTSDAIYELGSPSDTWGHTWSASEFDNGNFTLEVVANPSANTVKIDAIQVRVYHQATGGGGGGGGAVFREPSRYFANVYSAFGGVISTGMRSFFDWFVWN